MHGIVVYYSMSCGLQLETSVVSIGVGAWYCGLLECALWTTTRDKCSQYRCRCMVLWSITVCLVDYNSRQV